MKQKKKMKPENNAVGIDEMGSLSEFLREIKTAYIRGDLAKYPTVARAVKEFKLENNIVGTDETSDLFSTSFVESRFFKEIKAAYLRGDLAKYPIVAQAAKIVSQLG